MKLGEKHLGKIVLGVIAIICITLIEMSALNNGVDGQLLSTVLMIIAAIATGTFTYGLKGE